MSMNQVERKANIKKKTRYGLPLPVSIRPLCLGKFQAISLIIIFIFINEMGCVLKSKLTYSVF